MRRLLVSLAILAFAPLAAADETGARATVEFHKGFERNVNFARQEYMVVDADGQSSTSAALFGLVGGGEVRQRRYPASQRLTIYAMTTYLEYFGSEGRCSALAHFTPAGGHTYAVTQQELSLGVCELHVLDAATGAAPADLEISTDSGARR